MFRNEWYFKRVRNVLSISFTIYFSSTAYTEADAQDSAFMISGVNNTNSIVHLQQSASYENSPYPVEQSSLQHNIENGLSATNLEQSQHHQIIPNFNQTFNQWYSSSDDVFHLTSSYSTTDPFHHQSDSSASFHRSLGNISEPIGNTWAMENYSSEYSVHNQHLEPFNGAVCDTQNYYSEAAQSNNFPLHPEQSVIQPTTVQRDVQIGDQQPINGHFKFVNECRMASAPTKLSTKLNPSDNFYNRTQWREKVHRCKVCSTGYTTTNHLKRHFKTAKHLDELKKQGFRSRYASE